jgi:hypothetical protein
MARSKTVLLLATHAAALGLGALVAVWAPPDRDESPPAASEPALAGKSGCRAARLRRVSAKELLGAYHNARKWLEIVGADDPEKLKPFADKWFGGVYGMDSWAGAPGARKKYRDWLRNGEDVMNAVEGTPAEVVFGKNGNPRAGRCSENRREE